MKPRAIYDDKVIERMREISENFDMSTEFRQGQIDGMFHVLEGFFDADGAANPSYDKDYLEALYREVTS